MTIKMLSPRETTVLHLLAWGYTNSEAAARLGLSVKTIEAHKANAMRKLKIANRAALVRYAVTHGWMLIEAAPTSAVAFSEALSESHATDSVTEVIQLA